MIDKFLESVYTAKSNSRAIDTIFNFAWDVLDGLPAQQLDECMEKMGGPKVMGVEAKNPKYEIIDEVLRQVDFDRINITRLISFATIAFWARAHSKERPNFMKRVRAKLSKTESKKRVNALLQGLEVA